VFLTGATGFVGMEVLARYLERTDRRVYALVRGAMIARSRPAWSVRCSACSALITLMPSGWSRCMAISRAPVWAFVVGLDGLAERVSEVVHCAASVSFELLLQAARAINVGGTLRVLEFAERCHARGGLRRFSYISTAYIAGEHARCFSEDDLDVGQSFRNAYEQSKFEAECLLVPWMGGCRSRCFVRASSSASATAAGRRRSTCSTGRCARSHAAPMRRCPHAVTHRLTSCRSTTCRRDLRAQSGAGGPRASPSTSPRGRMRAAWVSSSSSRAHSSDLRPPV